MKIPSNPPEQSTEQISEALTAYLAEHPHSAFLEDGKVLFDMRTAKYSLSTEHGKCSLHLWSDERNLVRRITATTPRAGTLRLTALRFGQTRPQTLELTADRDRRTPSAREAMRTRYLRILERVLLCQFPDWKAESFRTAMDLEKSFGPAYARGILTRGRYAWAVIAVNDEESQVTIDGILTLGILWLHHCRESSAGKRLFQGLKIVVPSGAATLTASRLAWLNPSAAQWELWELDQKTEDLTQRDAADHGNLLTRLIHAPNRAAARERFAESAQRVLSFVPQEHRPHVEQKLRSSTELAFLLHGLEFARVRMEAGTHFQRAQQITFGAGPSETELTPENESQLRDMTAKLFSRRTSAGQHKDLLYRMAPERWLESVLRRDVSLFDSELDPHHVYTQVPAFAASDRGMLDLLSVSKDHRLAVIELKAGEDLHLALQGLDYWVRVRWHHLQNPDQHTGLGEFQRHGYFTGIHLSPHPPRLYLVAPSLHIHPATETILSYLSPRVEWNLIALDERWRKQIKVVWRKRSENKIT